MPVTARPPLAVDLGGSSLRVALASETGPGPVARRPVSPDDYR